MRRIICSILLSIVSCAAWGAKVNPAPFKILSIEFTGTKPEPGHQLPMILKWELADGYHAYVEQFSLKSVRPEGAPLRLQDIRKVKEFYDKTSNQKRQGVEGRGEIFAELQLPQSLPQGDFEGELELTYQACAADHCLLPKTVRATYQIFMEKAHVIELFGLSVSIHDWKIWLAVFFAGVLTSLTPCVFPLIPITLAVLGARKEHGRKRDGLLLSLSYVTGIAVTYAILGVVAALTGALFGSFLGHPVVVAGLALLFVSLGLSMLGWFTIETPSFLTNRLFAHKTQGGRLGAFMAGTIAGVVASPCVGPVLAALLTYVAQTQNVALGFALLFVFAFGLGQLFLLLGTFSSLQKVVPRSGPWMDAIKWIFSLSFFGLAVFYVRPFLNVDNVWRLSALLVGMTLMKPESLAQWRRKPIGLRVKSAGGGLLILVSAVIVVIGSPGKVLPTQPVISETSHGAWQPYSEDLVTAAKAAGQPVLVDFFADWCVACKELEAKTFSHPEVTERLKKFKLLRFDATQITPEFEALQKRFEIIGLPYVIFIDGKGVWRRDLTVTGFEDATQFLKRLETFSKP